MRLGACIFLDSAKSILQSWRIELGTIIANYGQRVYKMRPLPVFLAAGRDSRRTCQATLMRGSWGDVILRPARGRRPSSSYEQVSIKSGLMRTTWDPEEKGGIRRTPRLHINDVGQGQHLAYYSPAVMLCQDDAFK